jgi:TM2 domain-containing membrane protein YozV
MSQDDDIYDLGEVDHTAPHRVFAGSPLVAEQFEERRPGARRRPLRAVRGTSDPAAASAVGPALAGSLSIFVPGLGQMIAGELAWGLFYLSGMGFCGAAIWAVFTTLDRLVPTLSLLDVPTAALTATVGSLALLTMTLHLAAVLHAHAIAYDDGRTPPHPLVAGIASLVIPGWGQLLAGHRRRATLFLGGVWLLGTAWLVVTPMGTPLLARLGLALPSALKDGWGPVSMLAAPLVLWAIAVYDAAAGAAAERRAAA